MLFYYIQWLHLLTVKGNMLTCTNEFIETILLQVSSGNNYYTTGDDDIIFIKIGSNKVLLLDYTYHINIHIFRIIILMKPY